MSEQSISYSCSDSESKHDKKEIVPKYKGDSLFLYASAFAANLTFFGGGCNVVWTSPVISQLQSNNTEINPLESPITQLDVSLIAGLPFLGSVLGPLFLGKLNDIYGRRKILLCIALTMMASFIVLAFAKSVGYYIVSRMVLGACHGTAMAVLPIFITEITDKHNRGKFGCLMGVFQVTGSLYGFILGSFFSIKIFTLLCAAPLILCVASLILFIPESPYYLVFIGDIKEATMVLTKLRNTSNVTSDMFEIEFTLNEDNKCTQGKSSALFTDPIYRKAFVISTALSLLQVFSGTTAVLAFVGPIFDSVGTKFSGNSVAILVGTVKLVTYFVTSAIVERSGRKVLLIISCIGCCLPHFALGLLFYLKYSGSDILEIVFWLPASCVILFIINYSLGLGPIPTVFLSEVFPNNFKSIAVAIVTSISCTGAFAVTSLFPITMEYLGIHWCFWIFGTCCIFGTIFVYIFVPETKGKSLYQIQVLLKDMP